MNTGAARRVTGIVLLVALSHGLAACGGTKVIKEPVPLVAQQSLADTADGQLSVTLDWVIVRDGPGTWAKNADWDEYLIRVKNQGDETLKITSVVVTDSLGTTVVPGGSRKQLVKGTKAAGRRYKGAGLTAKAGAGTGTLIVAGAVTGAAAVGVGYAALYSGGAMAGAAVGGLMLAPVLAVGGVFRGINNSKVGNEIESRQAQLPLLLQGDEEKGLNFFFPMSPSPRQVEITYTDGSGDHIIVVDTRDALEGLHLVKATK